MEYPMLVVLVLVLVLVVGGYAIDCRMYDHASITWHGLRKMSGNSLNGLWLAQ